MNNKKLILGLALIAVTGLSAAGFGLERKIADFLPGSVLPFFSSGKSDRLPSTAMHQVDNSTSNRVINDVKNSSQKPNVPPEVIYLFLFKEVAAFEEKANEAPGLGEDPEVYRTVYKRLANLTNAQSDFLKKTAAACLKELKFKDETARRIAERLRSDYQKQSSQGLAPEVPPVSPELTKLQTQREAIILKYRDVLKAGMEDGFSNLESYVENHITSNIKINDNNNPVGPAPDMNRLNEQAPPISEEQEGR